MDDISIPKRKETDAFTPESRLENGSKLDYRCAPSRNSPTGRDFL